MSSPTVDSKERMRERKGEGDKRRKKKGNKKRTKAGKI
jgi:hypothetical protein